jgi:hypothetical protein
MVATELHIGVDFDNTIVCYDEVFHRLAVVEKLIPATLPRDKTSIRDYLRTENREDRWTAMQGLVYGKWMPDARPFDGILAFLAGCAEKELPVSIISHRTRQPLVGEPFDLHAAAFHWLEKNRFFDFVPVDHIFFEQTRDDKVTRVCRSACTHFIDDLPEFLNEPLLPPALSRILFDPANTLRARPGIIVASSWDQIRTFFRV